jgi:hypothetical protein
MGLRIDVEAQIDQAPSHRAGESSSRFSDRHIEA